MRGLGTDHVISGQMKGLEKNGIRWRKQSDRQTEGHCDSKTESALWAYSVKIKVFCSLDQHCLSGEGSTFLLTPLLKVGGQIRSELFWVRLG